MKVTGLKEFFNSVKAKDKKQFVIIAKGVKMDTVREFIERLYELHEDKHYILTASYEDFEIEFIEI